MYIINDYIVLINYPNQSENTNSLSGDRLGNRNADADAANNFRDQCNR